MKQKTITIKGAGISGLSAAITLAKNDIDVEVFEKASHVGGRFVRDFQGLRNFGNENVNPLKELEMLDIHIKPYKELKKIIRCSRLHSFELTNNNKPLYYLFLRGNEDSSIDSQLYNQTKKENVSVHYTTSIDSSKATIIATGPATIDRVAYGERYEDTNTSETGYVFIDSEYSPGGYCYVLPGEKKGELEVVNVTSHYLTTMKQTKSLFHKILENNATIQNLLEGAVKQSTQGGIGSCSLLEEPYQNNQYYVGEAAGLQDATAGFGMRYAAISGYLAAQSIISNENYNQQLEKSLKPQLLFDRKRHEHFKKLTNKEIDKIFQTITEKFGHELTIEEYESLRGEI